MAKKIERWVAVHKNGFEGEVRSTRDEAQADATRYNDETMIPLAKAADEEPELAEVVTLVDGRLLDLAESTIASQESNRKAQKRELKSLTAALEALRKTT
jgi:hypothetical protein